MKKVRVCHLSSTHKHLDPRAFYRQCASLGKSGYQVSFICPCGKNEVIEQVKLINFLRWNNRILRVIFSPLIIFPAIKQKAAIYHFHSIELIPAGLILKLLFRKRVIYDIREDYPSFMMLKYWIPKWLRKAISKAVYYIEQISTRIFDGIITADPFVLAAFPLVPSNRKIVFYNLPSLDIFQDLHSLNTEKSYDIVYLGGMSERAGTYVLIKAIYQLVLAGLKPSVLLMGYFDNIKSEEAINQELDKLDLRDNFKINGRVHHKNVPKLLSQAKIGIVPLQPVPKFLKNIPSKLFEYWACGLPVVASDLPPARLFFKNNEYGFLVNPTDPKAFADAFYWLMTNPDKAEEMGKNAQKAVFKTLNNYVEGSKLVKFYERILGNENGFS